MATKPKRVIKPVPTDEPPAEEAKELVAVSKIQSWNIEARRLKSRADDVRSDQGNLFKKIEDAGFSRDAFKMAAKLAAMEPHKQAAWLMDFERACEALKVGAQEEMFDKTGPHGREPKKDKDDEAQTSLN